MSTRPSSVALRAIRAPLIAVVAVASACADSSAPIAGPTSAGSALRVRSSQPVRPEEQVFADLEREVPGAAGFYYDTDGRLVVKLVNPGRRDAAARSIARFAARGRVQGRERGRAVGTPRFETAQFTFEQLRTWRDIAFDNVFAVDGVQTLDFDEVANRVAIGVLDATYDATTAAVTARLTALGVEPAALAFRRASPIRVEVAPAPSTIRDDADTVAGGLEIVVGNSLCSAGFVAERNGQLGVVTASHCTSNTFGLDGAPLSQGGTQVATETVDPNSYTCGFNNCRAADAAWFATTGNKPMAVGKIVRLSGLNNNSLEVDQVTPYWTIVEEENDNLVYGQRVDKIGRTTGWTSGWMGSTCVDAEIEGNNVIRCAYTAGYTSGGGDSGGPVIVILNYLDEVILAGVHFASDGTTRYFSKLWRIKNDLGGSWTIAAHPTNRPPTPIIYGPAELTPHGFCIGEYNSVTSYGRPPYTNTWATSGTVVENNGSLRVHFPTEGLHYVESAVVDADGRTGNYVLWVNVSWENPTMPCFGG